MDQKTKVSYMAAIALSVAFGLISFVALAKNDNAKNDKVKSEDSQKTKTVKNVDFKNFEKPDKSKGETNAQVHKEKIKNTVQNLEQVASQEEENGNTEVSEAIEEVIQEQEDSEDETAEAISEVESRGKVKSFLIGTDYKNLGQLRSELVHNRNQIRKLTQVAQQVQGEEGQTSIQEQLETLMQERERIKTVLSENEEGFSLFGWAVRFFNNYEQVPVDEEEEEGLAEEVADAIDTVETAETADAPTDDTTDTTTVDDDAVTAAP